MKLLFCPLITTCNNLLFMICYKNIVNKASFYENIVDKAFFFFFEKVKTSYFHHNIFKSNYWVVNSLQIKRKYNKILKLLWKFCVILWCFYKFFCEFSQICWTTIHYFAYNFLGLTFCIYVSLCTIIRKTT